ncbi:flagellar basal body-associated protein FliL [Peribacillus sp. SCS-26]|uniref:flagellar basal body-associated protein FliL n=1 Tax=Paraperibacillus marinus TaxID=3115295 RepID=UPI0039065C90
MKIKKKLVTIMLILVLSITLIGGIALVVVMKFTGDEKAHAQPNIDEIVEASVEVPEITTNLSSGDFIRISFTVQTDGKDAKEELEKRNFQVKNIIVSELSDMKAADLTGKAGKEKFEELLKGRIGSLMQEGKIVKVYITSSILQ